MDYKPPPPQKKSVDFRIDDNQVDLKSGNKPFNMSGSPANYFDIFDPAKNGKKPEKRLSTTLTETSAQIENKRKFTIDPNNDKLGQSLKDVNLAGFSFLAQTQNYFMRIFWMCLISAAIAFLSYELWKTVNDFVYSPVMTTYTLKTQDELDFPNIFICPAVFMNETFYDKNRQKSKDAMELLNTYDKIVSSKTNSSNITKERIFKKLDSKTNERTETDSTSLTGDEAYETLMKLGFNEEDILNEGQFYEDGKPVNLSRSDVEPILDHRYGKCFQISVRGMSQTNDAKGLSLTMHTFTKGYVKDKKLIQNYVGMFISVDSKYQPASYENVLVTPGTYTKISLSLEHFIMRNLESGSLIQPCKENEIQNLTIFDATYTQASCQMECVYKEVMSRCKCLPLINNSTVNQSIADMNFCGKDDTDKCVGVKVTNDEEAQKNIDDCQKKCLPPCESYRYKIRSSSAPLNKAAFSNNMHDNFSVNELIVLEVSFSRLEWLELKQEPSMTFDTFVGNAGGQITLWIGGCMFTLLPLPLSMIAFCVMSVVTKIQKRMTDKK